MKLLYEASNTVEAHMILNLLEQSGLTARIDGEFLQGGIGDLQVIGIVRVMVEESDYQQAKLIIQEWDAQQPEREVQKPAKKKRRMFGTGIIGFICGIAVTAVYYHTPVTYDGVDYNGDGQLDEKWTYVNNRMSRSETDRNFDGKIDLVYLYDRKGFVESSTFDDDFNGTFETEVYYEYGNAKWQMSDTTGDGFKNNRGNYKYGLIESVHFIDPASKKVIKVQNFGPHKLKSAEIDTTGDGTLDTIHEYDLTEEISNKYSKG